jgi:hypothetical protein
MNDTAWPPDVHISSQTPVAASRNISITQNDRREYKNLSIYITELPVTPNRFRDKYHRAREPSGQYEFADFESEQITRNISNITAAIWPIHRRDVSRAPRTIPTSYHRPQTNQMSYIPTVPIPTRPHTMNPGGTVLREPQGLDTELGTFHGVPSQEAFNSEELFELYNETAAAISDPEFVDELRTIVIWFQVLNESERTATLYALFQRTTQGQIRFLLHELRRMYDRL